MRKKIGIFEQKTGPKNDKKRPKYKTLPRNQRTITDCFERRLNPMKPCKGNETHTLCNTNWI